MILIGTNHADLLGYKRLDRMLHHFAPEHICIELPEGADLEKMLRQAEELERQQIDELEKYSIHPQIKHTLLSLTKGYSFELKTPARYAQRTGAILTPIDHPGRMTAMFHDQPISGFIQDLIQELEKLVDEKEPDYHISRILNNQFDQAYDDTKSFVERMSQYTNSLSEEEKKDFLQKNPSIKTTVHNLKDISFQRREDHVAKRLLELRPDIYICGIMHLARNQPMPMFGEENIYFVGTQVLPHTTMQLPLNTAIDFHSCKLY